MPKLLDGADVRDLPLLFIDLEFTGLDPKVHEIVEIAALLVSPVSLEITNSYYTKVKPVNIESADPAALKIIEYSDKEWKEAIPLRQSLTELANFATERCVLVGWGVQNEWDFLNAALEKENIPYFYDHRLIEVFTLAYAKLRERGEIRRLNLQNTAKYLGISVLRHKPDSDIKATYEIFRKLL